MLQAATLGDRQAMVYMAKAYETAKGLGSVRYSASTYRAPPITIPYYFFFCKEMWMGRVVGFVACLQTSPLKQRE